MGWPVGSEWIPRWRRERLANWWAFGDQAVPVLMASLPGADWDRGPDTDSLRQHWTDTELIVARAMWRIEHTDWLGAAVPYHYVDMGASAMAGVLGCPMEYIDRETVWAHPRCRCVDEVLAVGLGDGRGVYSRIRAITAASSALAPGHHVVAPFALEGMTDLMAALYGIEPFLMDLLDRPGVTAKAMSHLKDLWLRAFADIQELIASGASSGGIGWVGIWAPGSTFPLQEDVAYNLSPELFRRFCIPHIADQISVIDYPLFHVDGVGMIPHLPMLLELDGLRAIQWQPGAGKEELSQWYDLLAGILAAGMPLQVYASAREVDALVEAVGSRGLLVIVNRGDRDDILRLFDRYPQA